LSSQSAVFKSQHKLFGAVITGKRPPEPEVMALATAMVTVFLATGV
jgi:hypothetical protein